MLIKTCRVFVNGRLRRGVESATKDLERYRAELFQLKNETFLKDRLVGAGELD